MTDFTYKWGEDVRTGILDAWHYLHPIKDSRDSIEFLIYAFDMVQVNDESTIVDLVKEVIASNPEMVEKAKKNPKLAGWFAGQVLKKNNTVNPASVTKIIKQELEI